MLGFPLAFALQALVLHGENLEDLPQWLGIAAVFLVVGPSEEIFKALLTRWRAGGTEGFASPAEARMAGLAAAAGYTFLEHFGRFTTGGAPMHVLIMKATLGTSLHALASTIWGPALAGGAWLERAFLAGLVHGAYDAGAFLPAWSDAPQSWGIAAQVGVVVLLIPRLLARQPAKAPESPEPRTERP
ncbi:MAG: PrsW family intramembrane metalloprotease [Candidatus Wallbacteria bacterium]|nr:PrsW family intramembrane metalloprotease [Candidatus Wallbacteria bacterium]